MTQSPKHWKTETKEVLEFIPQVGQWSLSSKEKLFIFNRWPEKTLNLGNDVVYTKGQVG